MELQGFLCFKESKHHFASLDSCVRLDPNEDKLIFNGCINCFPCFESSY